MLQQKRLVILGISTLVLALLVQFPARVAYHWVAPAEASLSGISGTIWQGAAAEGQVNLVYLRNLRWKFRPWSLLVGKLAFSTQLELAGGIISTDVVIGLGSTVTFRNLDANLPIKALGSVVPIRELNGNIKAQFSELQWSDGLPVIAKGIVHISNLSIRQLAAMTIGDFEIEFNTADDGVIASVKDTAGILDLDGTFRVTSDRSYSLTGLVAPTATTPSTVVEQVSFLGSPNEQGQREFRFEGEL